MSSNQTIDAYLRRLHRAARRLPADERDELMIGIGAHVEQIRARSLSPEDTAAALEGLGDPEALVAEALGASARPQFRPRLVVCTLTAVWLSVLASLALGYMLRTSGSPLPYMVAGSLTQLGGLLVLILSLVGAMWRRWRDTFATVALLVAASTVSPVMVAVLGSNARCDNGGGLVPCSATSAGLFGRAVVAAALVAAVVGSVHWIRRLGRLRRPDRPAMAGPMMWATALGCAALLAVAYLASGQLGPAGKVIGKVINDTGHDVHVTVCPQQNCTGQPTTTLGNGDHIDLPPSAANIPDSVVIEAPGHPTVCVTSLPLPTGADFAHFTGTIDMPITQSADAETCGLDVQTLHNQ